MLQLFRKHVSSVASKIILAIVIVSFVFFWGIGDVLRGGGGHDVAQVGNRPINRSMFARELQMAIHRLEEQTQQKITPDMALSMGVVPHVLNEMIQGMLLEWEADLLKIGAPDESISDYIQEIPLFKNEAGRFDRQKLQQFLTQVRLSEKKFIETLGQDLKRQQLVQNLFMYPLGRPTLAPKVLNEIMTQYVYGDRHVQTVTLKDADGGEVPAPTEDQLKEFYNREGADFAIPEKRTFSVAWLDPRKKASHIKISSQKVQDYYDDNKSLFLSKHERVVTFVTVPKKEKAEEVVAGLKAGKKMEAVISSLKGKKRDVVLKTITLAKEEAEDAMTAQVFEKPVGTLLGPVLKEGQWHVLHIKEERPARHMSFQEVKESIQKKLQLEEAQAELSTKIKHLDDDLAAGTAFSDMARQYGMEVVRIENLNEKSEAAILSHIPEFLIPTVINQVGTLAAGETGPLVQAGGTYVVVRLEKVLEKRQPLLEEVKVQVREGWKKDEQRKRSEGLAEQMLKEVRGGLSLAKVAEKHGKSVQSSGVNGKKPYEASKFLYNLIMQMKPGEAGSGRVKGATLVVGVSDIKPHTPSEKEHKKNQELLSRQLAMDIMEGYSRQIKAKTKVTTYPRVIQSLFNREAN
jgi:peptidyl-prolyl cis-trans isomerase D